MAFYGSKKHLSKELQAIPGMFLGYLQFHQAAQDIQNNISLLGRMSYEDWEIQAWTYKVSHGDSWAASPTFLSPNWNLAENNYPLA